MSETSPFELDAHDLKMQRRFMLMVWLSPAACSAVCLAWVVVGALARRDVGEAPLWIWIVCLVVTGLWGTGVAAEQAERGIEIMFRVIVWWMYLGAIVSTTFTLG